jgi:hypothetical protein
MNQMTYNSPFMNPYGPTPIILSPEEKKRKREAEQARRQAEYQNQMARSQGMLGVQNVGALGQPMTTGPITLPESAHQAGSDTGDVVNTVGRGIADGVSYLGNEYLIPGGKVVADTLADGVEGGINFFRGATGFAPNEEGMRFRNGDGLFSEDFKSQLGIPNGGALNSEMPNGSQADLSGLEKYRANGVLEDARRKMNDTDMGGAGVLRLDTPVDTPVVTPVDTPIEAAVKEVVKESDDPVSKIAETSVTEKAKSLQNIGDAANVDRSGTATGNKRDQTRMAIPRIGMAEKLMRIGGAITGASTQGLSAAMAAGSGAYGQLQDEERRLAQVEQQNQMSMLSKLQAMNKKTAQQEKQESEDRATFQQTQSRSTRQSFLAKRLRQEGDGVTGRIDGTVIAFTDEMIGNPRSHLRLQLEKEAVDAALVSVAQTKGAISNREMELFLKPIPRIGKNQESTWIAWLEMQSALNAIKAKRLDPSNLNPDGSLKTRVQVDAEASAELEQLYQNLLDTGYTPYGSGQSIPDDDDELFDLN